MVTVLLGALQSWLGGALSQKGEQTPGCRVAIGYSIRRENGVDIIPSLCADLRHKLSTYVTDQAGGAMEVLTVLVR